MKILLVGYGSIGRRHYSILKKIAKVDIVTSQNIPQKVDIKKVNLKKYDYFVISNETYKHFDTLKFIVERVNNKKILVEKPLFKSNKKLNIKKNDVYVAYNLRFHPIIQYLKSIKDVLVVNIVVGQYLPDWRTNIDYKESYSAFREKGGGVLRDLSHEIDYINYLFNIKKIKYAWSNKISNLEIDSDDIFMSILKTQNGIVNLSMDYISKIPTRYIIMHTNDRTIKADFIKNRIIDNDKIVEFEIDKNYTYTKMHLDIIKNKKDVICSYKEGLKIVKFIEKVSK